jgi:hypothetical protein
VGAGGGLLGAFLDCGFYFGGVEWSGEVESEGKFKR